MSQMFNSPLKGLIMRVVLVVMLFLSSVSSFGQQSQIPEGVKIKAATPSANASAKAALEQALKNGAAFPAPILGDTVTCGPTLWAALKMSADETLLKSKVVTAVLPSPVSLTVPARGLLTVDQRKSFWLQLLAKYPALKSAMVRKPTTDEIRYFWATIPFESIEEPFFTIEAGPQRFIVNLQADEKKTALFWIDLVGDLHELANQNLTPDELKEFVTAADAGMPLPMYTVGRAFLFGKGTPADVEKGKKWLDAAAGQGSMDAQMLLGSAYMSGKILSKDPQLAAKYVLLAAQNQNVDGHLQSSLGLAQYWVAVMYDNGAGLEKSNAKALEYLQLAAANGNKLAQFDVGSLYNDGKGGVPMDKARACDLFEKAADQGHEKAMHNVAFCYQVGVGGKKDEQKAIKYYTQAGEAGLPRAQHNLGLLFGRMGNAEKAYFWLRLAEAYGDAEVKSPINEIKAHLTDPQVASLDQEIAAWLKTHKAKEHN